MDEKVFQLRRYYFGFLYLSFVYIAVLLFILGKDVKPLNVSFFEEIVIGSTGIIPAAFVFMRMTGYIFEKRIYLILLAVNQLPLIVGNLLCIVKSNYIYFFLSYPIFLIGSIVLLPTRKGVKGGGRAKKS